jgi:putative oxidoreductase
MDAQKLGGSPGVVFPLAKPADGPIMDADWLKPSRCFCTAMGLYSLAEQKAHRPDVGLLALRVVFGVIIFLFGVEKLMGGGAMFEQIGQSMGMFGVTWHPKVWGLLCALTETFGGLCIVFGVFFRPAALLLVFNMVVATLAMAKMSGSPDFASIDTFMNNWLSKVAIPVYFLAVFLTLLFCGAGKYALQKKGGGRSASKSAGE